jgi:hypothetical protein
MADSESVEARRVRAAKNESLFREVNEGIEEFGRASAFVPFVCECFERDCMEHVSLTIEEYEQIRQDANRFIVVPGHEQGPEIEEVVGLGRGYVIVSKLGEGAEVAEELDPRQRESKG